MKNKLNNGTLYVFLAYMLGIIAVSQLLTGCYTEKDAVRQTTKAQANYPGSVAGLCALWYPIQTYTKENTVYKQGPTITKRDTSYVTVDCDSAVAAAKKNGQKADKTKAPCPPCDSLRVDTLIHLQQTLAESTSKLVQQKAEQAALQKDFNTAMQQIATKNQQNKTLRLWIWVLGLYTAARWILRFATKGRIKLP